MKAGETLEIWADDPAAERDLQSLAKRLGHELVHTQKAGSKLIVLIRKGK
jgi:TusA-related sulfurtransferase